MTGTPRKGPTTAAMRLRPAAGKPAPPRPAVAILAGRLGAVLELHREGELVPLCRECLLPHPCPTYLAAGGEVETTDTTEEGSQ